jgi:hypothetical protein
VAPVGLAALAPLALVVLVASVAPVAPMVLVATDDVYIYIYIYIYVYVPRGTSCLAPLALDTPVAPFDTCGLWLSTFLEDIIINK